MSSYGSFFSLKKRNLEGSYGRWAPRSLLAIVMPVLAKRETCVPINKDSQRNGIHVKIFS
jgi:hypothetical protein